MYSQPLPASADTPTENDIKIDGQNADLVGNFVRTNFERSMRILDNCLPIGLYKVYVFNKQDLQR